VVNLSTQTDLFLSLVDQCSPLESRGAAGKRRSQVRACACVCVCVCVCVCARARVRVRTTSSRLVVQSRPCTCFALVDLASPLRVAHVSFFNSTHRPRYTCERTRDRGCAEDNSGG
jgi:hypothetical protein